jgi:hypothetical protein
LPRPFRHVSPAWLLQVLFTTSLHAPETAGHPRTGPSIRDEEISQEHFVELDSRLASFKQGCGEGEDPIRSLGLQWGPGRRKQCFRAVTAWPGASNADCSCVLKSRPKGKLIGLPIGAPDGFHDRKRPSGACAPKIGKAISSNLVGSQRGFRWDGQLIFDEVTGIPPGKNGVDDVAESRGCAKPAN